MNLVDEFIARAGASGAKAEALPLSEVGARLALLLDELGLKTALLSDLGAIPGLAETVAAALSDAGCEILPPERGQEAELGITVPDALIADTGSQVALSNRKGAMTASLLPPVHLAIAAPSSLLPDMAGLLDRFRPSMPSRLTIITGPSRTGDIEATMTTGVHGPGKILIWIAV